MSGELADMLRQANDMTNPNRRKAEEALREFETRDGFGIQLLVLVQQTSDQLQLQAVIYFKNFVQRNWTISDDGQKYVNDRDRHEIKQALIPLMLNAAPIVKRQLSAAITLIAGQDFPADWQDLLPTLTERLRTADEILTFGALEIIESITKRYVNANINKETHDHIRYIINNFSNAWLELLKGMADRVERELPSTTKENNRALKLVIHSATLLVQMFWDLHTVDIIDWFEERMEDWVPLFLRLLQAEDQQNVLGALDNASGPLEKLRAQIMRTLVLYNNRYEEQYRRFVPQFVQTTCQLVSRLNSSERFDELISQSIAYLSSVVRQQWHRGLFDQNKMELIVQHIIIPNIMLRESDMSMYEVDGETYVSRDLEGSDMETRRRGVSDLISGLLIHFEDGVSSIVVRHTERLLEEYKKDPQNGFIAKDAAITLFLAVAVKGKTRNAGATLLNERVNVPQFFSQNILPVLQRQEKCHQLICADAIKFLIMFRSTWDDGTFQSLLGLLVSFLGEEDYVLHTYAAFAINKLLAVKAGEPPNRFFRFPTAELVKYLSETLTPLLTIVTTRAESYTNKHVMSAVLRVVVRADEGLSSVIVILLERLALVLERICKRQGKPDFNHVVFEVIAAAISSICRRHPEHAANFETHLCPILFSILDNDNISEFHPYAYQLFALLLRVRPDVSENYQTLFDKLLLPGLWTQEGTIRAISGMFGDYLARVDVNKFVSPKRLEGILGIFQKLLADRGHDFHAFEVLRSVFEYVSLTKLTPNYVRQIFMLCFQRLQLGKRAELCCNMVVCLGSFIVKHGVPAMLDGMNLVQTGIFSMVVGNVWLPYARKITNLSHRRIATFAMVKMLESNEFWQTDLKKHIPKLFEKTIELFEVNPEEDKKGSGDHLENLEAQGFDTKFSRLNYAFAPKRDITKDMGDPREAFVRVLVPRLQSDEALRNELSRTLEELYKKQFNTYCERAGLSFTL